MTTENKQDSRTASDSGSSLQRMVSPLFLYLKSCKLEKPMLKKLQDAGYIPIAVESFDDIKIVDALPIGATNAISRAAFQTIAESDLGGVKERFGNKIARTLAAG